MIKIIETPQFSTASYIYAIDGDSLVITMDDKNEVLDLTGLDDGHLEQIEMENIALNPIISIEKVAGIITITLIRFYNKDEKELFECGDNQMEN